MTRDAAPRLGHHKTALIESRFFPALQARRPCRADLPVSLLALLPVLLAARVRAVPAPCSRRRAPAACRARSACRLAR